MYLKISEITGFVFSSILLMAATAYALNNVGEKCTISKGSGYIIDSCDGSKLLSCQNGRCACNDPYNQIYTYKQEREKRYKRGIGKNVAIGAGGAFIGYQVAKATNAGPGGPHQSSNGYGWGNSFHSKKIYSCYGLVGSPCALNYNNVKRVKTTVVNVTSEVNSKNGTTNETSSITNSTTTTEAPTEFDIHKLSKCVFRAVCKPFNSSDTSVRAVKSADPRVGVCTCDGSSIRTNADLCESEASSSNPSKFFILALITLHCTISEF